MGAPWVGPRVGSLETSSGAGVAHTPWSVGPALVTGVAPASAEYRHCRKGVGDCRQAGGRGGQGVGAGLVPPPHEAVSTAGAPVAARGSCCFASSIIGAAAPGGVSLTATLTTFARRVPVHQDDVAGVRGVRPRRRRNDPGRVLLRLGREGTTPGVCGGATEWWAPFAARRWLCSIRSLVDCAPPDTTPFTILSKDVSAGRGVWWPPLPPPHIHRFAGDPLSLPTCSLMSDDGRRVAEPTLGPTDQRCRHGIARRGAP